MHIKVLGVFFLFSNLVLAQVDEAAYHEMVPKYILTLWENKGAANNAEFQIEELDELKSFLHELSKRKNHIASPKFLTKPTYNTMVGHYLALKLKWNSFNGPHVGLKRLKPSKVIGKALNNLPSKRELLAHYYLSISSDILNKQKPMDLRSLNIDFNALNLINDTEKAILFLCLMRHMGGQVRSYSLTRFPDNCFRAKTYVENMPLFNGKEFFQFELPKFEDFKIEVDKRYPKMSFKERYLPEFEQAKLGYKKCLSNEKG
ncbi:hypothetical protein [Flagellimonas algicola]|uniref:Transglutaminase superfamily protein n=1 Tax=Flagellimonas algicola TaxID=2583815 RepID=A0ABY2WI11_9FLAO|nr:hypothetical protein [Allomuricauda algicola]TMU50995.1 hypothetical protein FGG15_17380 [Allomuricauda algicola]